MSELNVTALLEYMARGDAEALDRLFPLVYQELHRVAHRQLQHERAGHILDTTALVHEDYLKRVKHPPDVEWQSGSTSSRSPLRPCQILVNHAKARSRAKRGGDAPHVSLDEAVICPKREPTSWSRSTRP